MTIKDIRIYYNGNWISIINQVETNNIQLQGRADEAFALGTFTAWLDISTNIAPYTPLIIERYNNTLEYLMCKSRANKYLTQQGLWVHEITAMEATSVLACFILGSKNFGVTGQYKVDSSKVVILQQLMEYKYNNVRFTFSNNETLNMQQEFTFGKGTTLYDALVEIAKTYNRLPKVKTYSLDATTGKWVYDIEFIDLSGGSEYQLDETKLISLAYDQDTDNYCNRLEAEVDNVIDRTNTMVVKNVTFRSDEVLLSEDNAFIKLPTKIEQIKSFGANAQVSTKLSIFNIPLDAYVGSEPIENLYYQSQKQPLINWLSLFRTSDDEYIVYKLVEKYINDFYIQNIWQWEFYLSPSSATTLTLTTYEYHVVDVVVPMENFVITKKLYDSLEATFKPSHAYYESGGQTIEGFNQTYKNDFWNKLLGLDEAPTLTELITSYSYDYILGVEDTYKNMTMTNSGSQLILNDKFLKHTFNIEYVPIVDMLVSSNKRITPNNEASYKDYSRTYNIGANFIDYDRLQDSIQKTNDMLGNSELMLEYMTDNPPYATQYIMYDNVKWYVASVVRYIQLSQEYCLINLVRDYNKVAEAIGIKTQFNETKNPLENIIDRHIYLQSNEPITINTDNVYFQIGGKNDLYKKATILSHGSVVYLVCEAEDQYNFASQVLYKELSDSYYQTIQIEYGNSYNEYASYNVSLVEIENLTLEQSLALPFYSSGAPKTTIIDFGSIPVYKDARERLIFTIKLTNATIK